MPLEERAKWRFHSQRFRAMYWIHQVAGTLCLLFGYSLSPSAGNPNIAVPLLIIQARFDTLAYPIFPP